VAAACAIARAGGIREGMTLAEAMALQSRLIHHVHDPRQDLLGLERLGRWMMARCSPQVALEPPDALLVEIGGSVQLFGGLDVIARRVAASLRQFRISGAIAVGPTAGAAWALAAAGQARIVNESQVLAALDPLPVRTLRIDSAVADALHRVGVETIGELIRLPRSALPARFGPQLLERIDHATGRLAEPLVWLAHRTPLCERMIFDGLIESLEAVWAVLEQLVIRVVAELTRRGAGARQLRLRFDRERPPPLVHTIALSRPSRESRNLLDLLRLSTEALNTQEGFIAIELAVVEMQKLAPEQASFAPDATVKAASELVDWVDRMRARLGDAAVSQPQLIEAHVPERAYAWARATAACDLPTDRIIPPRPMYLLSNPIEIKVVVTPSNDRQGRPASFTHRGRTHHLRFAVGPERIAGTWWVGHSKTRDYFDVEDEAGRRFWIFRVTQTFKWYLHGRFE
jgi:protein ImuB